MEQDLADIRKASEGDRAAFARLVGKYQAYVFTISLRVLKDREVAEEAAQDTFIKVYKTLSSYRRDAKFSTWLYSVAYRTALDYARKKKTATQSLDNADNVLQIEDTADTPLQNTENNNLREVLAEALRKLPGVDGTIVSLYYQGGKSVKEIAGILGLSPSNVKVKLHRTREVLRHKLSQHLRAELKDLL